MFSGPGAVFSLAFLRALTTSSLLKESLAAADLRDEIIASSWVLLSFSNLEKEELRSLGRNAGLLSATWIVLWVEGAVFTAAMFLNPCRAGQRLPCVK